MRWLGALLAAAVSAMLAQAKGPQGRSPRGAADAGSPRSRGTGPVLLGTDPPGRLRAFGTPDAGSVAQVDAGADELRREVQELRARVSALEQERGRLQQQSQQLDEVVRQLQELRGQLADGEARRQSAEQQQGARREELQSGVSALQQAQSMLAYGDASVDAQLAQAQASFPPQAQKDLAAARAALSNRDLSAARAYLSAAIAHAQQGR